MPKRSIWICYSDRDKVIQKRDYCQNDPRAENEIDHTLVIDGRYLVSPIQSQKAPMYSGRSCVFLKPRRVRDGVLKATVCFEDDGSKACVDPRDLLPYEKGLSVCCGSKDGVHKETNPDGPLSDQLRHLRGVAFDIDRDAFKNKFRFLVGTWFCLQHKLAEAADSELIDDLNGRLYQMLGPGHDVCSCVQFMQGQKGKRAFEELKSAFKSMESGK